MTRAAILRTAFPRFIVHEGGKEEAWAAQANGENNPWRIWIWSGIENRAAVAAQELYEWRFRMLVGLGSAAALAVLTGALAAFFEPLLWWMVPLAAWAAFVLVPQLHVVQRRKELMSHEIEVQAAVLLYGADADAYRLREAGGMASYAWLKTMTAERITAAMKRHTPAAARWVRRNRPFLEKVRDFEFEGEAR
jgi:hypothetical protein